MKKSWGLLPKILAGEKTIESRWYKTKHAPWGKITKGDSVYFKNSGEPVTVVARVKEVKSFENLDSHRVKSILDKYGEHDGIKRDQIPNYHQLFEDKKYCLLIFLERAKTVKPFEINKTGFGAMAAWLTTPHISSLRR